MLDNVIKMFVVETYITYIRSVMYVYTYVRMYVCMYVCMYVYDQYTWADHLIPAHICFREIIIRSEMATEWDTWQLCTSVCAKPEVGISPHSLCGGPLVNT